MDLLGVDISSQGSPPPLSTPCPQIRWDETHDFSACAASSCSTSESWFQTYAEVQLESTASNDLMKAGFADPAAFGLPVRGLICQSPKDWFATRLVSLPRLSSLMRASAGTCRSTILQFCLAKRSTVTTHPQQFFEENQGPSHCGSSLVSLGKYCKNPVTSRDYLNNAIGLFAPMAACCTPSVDMAISQTWQPKVTNTIPYNFSKAFCWIEVSWILPKGLSINLCETDSTVFPQQNKLRFGIPFSSVSFGPNACGNWLGPMQLRSAWMKWGWDRSMAIAIQQMLDPPIRRNIRANPQTRKPRSPGLQHG